MGGSGGQRKQVAMKGGAQTPSTGPTQQPPWCEDEAKGRKERGGLTQKTLPLSLDAMNQEGLPQGFPEE